MTGLSHDMTLKARVEHVKHVKRPSKNVPRQGFFCFLVSLPQQPVFALTETRSASMSFSSTPLWENQRGAKEALIPDRAEGSGLGSKHHGCRGVHPDHG